VNYLQQPSIKIATAGSVDDGKSTLIGRLLVENDGLFDDQVLALKTASANRGFSEMNLALVTDGLRAERDQGITIDVAYRYFTTMNRRLVLADCPGHLEYTRNMVSGCSDAQVLVVLTDIVRGVTEQTWRHLAIGKLFNVPSVIVCINKMDQVSFAEAEFHRMRMQIEDYCARLELNGIQCIPVSALLGDNISASSKSMPWFREPPLLSRLESGPPAPASELRASIQRTTSGVHYAYVESGELIAGTEVRLARSGKRARIEKIFVGGVATTTAIAGTACVVSAEASMERGEVLLPAETPHALKGKALARVCWFREEPLTPNVRLELHVGTDARPCTVSAIHSVFSFMDGKFQPGASLSANAIGEVVIEGESLYFDPDPKSFLRKFILVDLETRDTVATGLLIA
jgi:sulfate adenylyltransferase subunit 1